MQLCGSLSILWRWLSLWLEWKLTFSSLVATSEFSKFASILSTTFTESSLRIWNDSAGILPSLLASFVVMLPKAHLASHSKMSGSRWVITQSWLSGSWRSFLYSYSMYSCHLFFISSASVRFIPFLPFIVLIFVWSVPLVSLIFLKRSLVFPILLFSSTSLHWSLTKVFLPLLVFFGTLHSVGYGIFPFSFAFFFSSFLSYL